MFVKNKEGVTMLELLIVIMLVSLIASMGFGSYKIWQRKILLINTHDEIKSALIRAQQLATAASGNNDWGLHLATSSYTIFPGSVYDPSNINNKIWNLENVEIENPETTFSNALGVYGPDVIFSKFEGEANNTGTVSIILSVDPSYNKSIEVRAPGQID